jgi:hypothetical protein
LANLWNGEGSARNYHIAADVGIGVFYPHWSGISSGPALGTAGSVNVFGDNRMGAGVGWSEFNQSSTRTGTWNFSHRP